MTYYRCGDLIGVEDNPCEMCEVLVVIDPEDREQVERLGKLMRASGCRWSTDVQAALREFANPTPPKPDEPLGLGAVVEDSKGGRWTRTRSHDHGLNWRAEWGGMWRTFDDIPDVRVLSPGYTEDGA